MDRKIGGWTLHEEIGRGGMGIVYRATNPFLPGNWAIKVMRSELGQDEDARKRFINEISILARSEDPRIVKIQTPFEDDGKLYLPMELLSGRSLADELAANPGPWSPRRSVEIMLAVAQAVGTVHRFKPDPVLHRDIKPGNIQILSDGRVKVLDFGLARSLGEESITADGHVVGSPKYMAPEVLHGDGHSTRSDVWGMGMVLYRLLAGRLPYDLPDRDSSIQAVFMAVATGIASGLPEVREIVPAVPTDLAVLVMRTLSRDPAGRPADGAELATLLGRLRLVGANENSPAGTGAGSGSGSGHLPLVGANENSPAGTGAGGLYGRMKIRPSGTGPGSGTGSGTGSGIPGPDADSTYLGIDLDKAASQSGASRGGVSASVPVQSGDLDRSLLDISVPGAGARAPVPPPLRRVEWSAPSEVKNSRKVMVPLIVVAVVALSALAVWYFGFERPSRSGESPVISNNAESAGAAAPSPVLAATSNSDIEWVRIPGGTYQMGSDDLDAGSDEKPVHTVMLSTYEMAKTETTVAQYRKCVEAGVCTTPDTGDYCNWGQSGRDNHPINCIDWNQASAYAKWIGGRLPTEAEWEYAARSAGLNQKYPWGDQTATCEYAVMNDGSGWGCGRDRTWPVCSKPAGNTTQGLCDMAGNVWEWVSDWFGSYGSGSVTNPTGPSTGSDRVYRGGSWSNDASYVRARYVRAAIRNYYGPGYRNSILGLRPARSLP